MPLTNSRLPPHQRASRCAPRLRHDGQVPGSKSSRMAGPNDGQSSRRSPGKTPHRNASVFAGLDDVLGDPRDPYADGVGGPGSSAGTKFLLRNRREAPLSTTLRPLRTRAFCTEYGIGKHLDV